MHRLTVMTILATILVFSNVASAHADDPVPGTVRTFAGIPMVYIPPGDFMMGSPGSELGHEPIEERLRKKTVEQGFWMSRYEISQAQWVAVMGRDANRSEFRGLSLPVQNVSWNDCHEFIRRLNRRSGLPFRLPTELEWEYACRAGAATAFHFGDLIATSWANYDGRQDYANSRGKTYRGEPVPPGMFPPNDWGLHDMHGNVWEWCETQYGVTWFRDPHTTGPPRVIRGGGWLSSAEGCRSAYAYAHDPASRRNFVGFRLCLSAGIE